MRRFLLLLLSGMSLAAAEPDLHQMLISWLREVAFRQLAARRQEVAAIRTRGQFEQRRAQVRTRLLQMIGGLPAERTPLNARRTGSLDRGDYRVEKIVFERPAPVLRHRQPLCAPNREAAVPRRPSACRTQPGGQEPGLLSEPFAGSREERIRGAYLRSVGPGRAADLLRSGARRFESRLHHDGTPDGWHPEPVGR